MILALDTVYLMILNTVENRGLVYALSDPQGIFFHGGSVWDFGLVILPLSSKYLLP